MAGKLAVSFVIGAALSGSFNVVLGRSINQFNKLGNTINQIDRQSRRIKSFRTLKSDLSATGIAYQKARDRVAGLHREMQRSEQPTQKMRAALAQAQRQSHQLNHKLTRQREALVKQRRAMRDAGLSTTRLDVQEKRLGATVDKLRRRYRQLGAAMNSSDAIKEKRGALRAQLVDAVALGAAIAAPVKAAMRFESVMADIKKVVDFERPAQFKAMGKDILRLSATLPMAADGIGAIVAAAGQAGIARRELLRFAEDAAKMGVAFDMAGKEAGSAMSGMRSIFQLNQDQVVLLGDAYNHLSNNMDATAKDMLKIANRTGATAKLFGLSGQQVGALGATFLALKTPPEVAATGINALLLKLKTADKQGRRFQGALAAIGIDAEGLKQAIEQDAQGALLDFLKAVQSADDVAGTLSDLFGAEYADDMAKLVGGLNTYRKALGLVVDQTAYAGSMQEEYEARAKTTENNLQLFRNQVTRLGVTIGSVLLPPLNSLSGIVGKAFGSIAGLAERFPIVTKVVVGLTMGLIAIKVAAIAGGYAWTFVQGAWFSGLTAMRTLQAGVALATMRFNRFNATALITSARTRALAVGGAIKSFAGTLLSLAGRAIPAVIGGLKTLRVALLTNPIGLIVGGIALAASLIIAFWTPIKGFFAGLWSDIQSIFSSAWEWLKGILSFSPLGLIIGNWSGISGFFTKLWRGIVAQARAAFSWLLDKFEAVTGFIGRVWDKIKGWFGGNHEATPKKLVTAKPDLKSLALATTVAAVPVAAQPVDASIASISTRQPIAVPQSAGQTSYYNSYQITIQQHPGQDGKALADEMMREIERRQQQRQREMAGDGI